MRNVSCLLFSALRRRAVWQEQKFNKEIGFQIKTSCVAHVILRWQMLGRSPPAESLCVIPAKRWLHSAVSSRFSVGQGAGAVLL